MNARGAGVVEGGLAHPALSKLFLEKLLVIFAYKPRYKVFTD